MTHTPGPWPAPEYDSHENDWWWDVGHIAKVETSEADARLIAAAPDLLAAQTMGATMNTPDFLDWIADRLVQRYLESEHVDFILSLRERAKAARTAIAKATGPK